MGRTLKDLTGQTFGRLTVLRRATSEECGNNKKLREVKWVCECNCKEENKNIIIVPASRLVSGQTKSCGCYRRDNAIEFNKKTKTIHGDRYTHLYSEWIRIKTKCKNKDGSLYLEWRNNYISFKEWSMNNGYNDLSYINKIDPNGNYEPSNCKWTLDEDGSHANHKKPPRILEYNGKEYNLSQLSRETNISKAVLLDRLDKQGMGVEEAINTPIKSTERIEEYNGDSLSLAEWGNIMGIVPANIYSRLAHGWTFEQAITTANEKVPINGVYFLDENDKPISQDDYFKQ